MRRQLAVCCAVLMVTLVVAGCSSGGADTNTSSGTPTVTPSGSATATPLDAQSTAWFDTLCQGLTQTIEVLDQSGIAGTGSNVPQQTIVSGVQQASSALGDSAGQLAALPPPTFASGEQVANGVIGAMQSASSQMTTSSTNFASIDPADGAALQSGRISLQTELQNSLGFLRDLGKFDPAVTSEIVRVPSCSLLAR